MMLNALINTSKKQYLNLLAFLAKGEIYTDIYKEDRAKLLKVALDILMARDSPSSFPNCSIAGYWYGDTVFTDIFTSGYVSLGYSDVTQDVMAALYNNGHRADLMSMVDKWVDSSDREVVYAAKLMKEGRYREVLSLPEHVGSREWTEFFVEFGKLMIAVETGNTGGSQ
jgi:hypothetical protein